jgi:UPF0176 protein
VTFKIIAFYKFVHLDERAALKVALKDLCAAYDLCGTILLAPEGINASVAGAPVAIDAFLAQLRKMANGRFSDIEPKVSFADERPFGKMKVRLKKEIITFGAPETGLEIMRGVYVNPRAWNELIARPGVKVVDTRNTYEVAMGTFERAIDPKMERFTEFKQFVHDHLDPQKDTDVAMFCTGGIRCEKATAYLLHQGFKNVYHLEGGILKYLEEVPETESRFRGECYVFDNRITVANGLEEGSYTAVPHTDNVYVKKS